METMQFHITKMYSFLGMDFSNCIMDDIKHTGNNVGLMMVCGNMFMSGVFL